MYVRVCVVFVFYHITKFLKFCNEIGKNGNKLVEWLVGCLYKKNNVCLGRKKKTYI